ncbi:MAG: hypothetical protein J7604_06410 [Sporocytophaga sp.]|uniref:hypothetical protein n=1 Tax=Sporocytophaga sp. TaxID=2231183 RepID=UPI001B1934C8|nr:hypothetical protein [Sporocytophaga sp.]MBO9699825.1 hypothetical protein [Sporocytophaga sp.]
MWFKKLTGLEETSPEVVRNNIIVKGNNLYSKANGRSFQFGSLQIPSLKTLKEEAPPREVFKGKISVSEVVANVQQLHCDSNNQNALFQAASQFNLLEMVGPHITPERGIDIYEKDNTQGPACAIACGAGTIYRNYFVPVNGQTGQSANFQIDCLDLIGEALNYKELELWKMRNGYALLTQDGLLQINRQINEMSNSERENLKEKLKIGIQWDTEVTLTEQNQIVSQAYCSALPVAYSHIESFYWESFARIILEATYEATLYAALINLERTDSNKVFLTLIGGGAFGNALNWILESLAVALKKFISTPLDVKIVSYGNSNPLIQKSLHEI